MNAFDSLASNRITLSIEESGTSHYRGSYIMTCSNRGVEPTVHNIRKLCASTGFAADVPKIWFRFNDIFLFLVLS